MSAKRRFAPLLWVALLAGAILAGLYLLGTRRGSGGVREAAPDAAGIAPADGAAQEEPSRERDQLELAEPWATDDVAIVPGVRLSGPGRLQGRILERESGNGVGGVRVDLLPITPSASDLLGTILRLARASDELARGADAVAVTISAEDGTFDFEGVRRGTYFLDARGPYHVPDHLIQVRVSAAGDGGPVDAYVRRGGRVVGTVRHADGRPVARGQVSLFHGPGVVLRAFRSGDLRRLDAETGRDGSFAFAGVTPGEGYELHAIGAGFAVTHHALPEVRAGEDVVVDVVVRPGVTIEGRVLASSSSDEGESAEATPLAGAELGAVPRGLRDLQFAEEILEHTHAVTDEHGRYAMRGVPPGEVELIAIAPAHLAATSEVLRLPPTGEFSAPDLVLQTGPLVRGRVVDATGNPVPGVHVRWFTARVADPETFAFSFASLMHQAIGSFRFPTTDADGRFVAGPFPDAPPHNFYCAKGGYAYTRVSWDPAEDGDEVEVMLTAGGSVEGIVMDARAARPVTQFIVSGADRIDRELDAPSSWNPFSGGEMVEDPSGRFRIDGVLVGESSLTFSAPGYQRREVTVQVVEGEVTKGVIVKLDPGGSVRGRVTNREDQPVAGASVGVLGGEGWDLQRSFNRLEEHRGRGRYSDTMAETVSNTAVSVATRMGFLGEGAVTTDPDGRYELQSIPPGKFTVVVRHRDYALAQTEPLELGEGAELEGVDVVLSRGASLFGRITDRFDRPLAGAILIAVSPSEFSGDSSPGAALYQGIADEGGDYEIPHMAGGGYLVSSLRGDAAMNPMAIASTLQFDLVNVPPDQRVRHDVVDQSAAACRVFGSVSSAGRPVGSGGIIAMTFEGESLLGVDVKATQVNSDATYEFPGLAPGAYEFIYQGGQGGENELRLDVEIPDLPEHHLDIELPWGGVEGRVLDDLTGEPFPGCRVTLQRPTEKTLDGLLAMFMKYGGRDARTVSGSEGRFAFQGQQAGAYELSVDPPRNGPLEGLVGRLAGVPVEIRRNEITRDVELRLTRALAITGVVRADGQPVADARVVAYSAATPDRPAGRDLGDADGRFALETLPAGEYELVASASGFAESAPLKVVLDADPVGNLELVLEPGCELTLLVRGRDGSPLPGAVAVVFGPAGRLVVTGRAESVGRRSRPGLEDWFSGETVSDAEGRLVVGPLRPSAYRLEVRQGGRSTVLDPVEIGDDPQMELEVVLE